jgi:hypothetical protein
MKIRLIALYFSRATGRAKTKQFRKLYFLLFY